MKYASPHEEYEKLDLKEDSKCPAIDRMDSMNLYPLKIIRTTNEYEKALKSMEVVFDEETGRLADYAESFTLLIAHYEEENFPVKTGQSVEAERHGMTSMKL